MFIKNKLFYLLLGCVFSISFVSRTALACNDPTEVKPTILIKCHGDGTIWIIIKNVRTFGSAGDMFCGCGLTLAPELGILTGATLEVDGQTVMNFTPNTNTRLEGGGELQQGVATAEPVIIEAGLSGELMLNVQIPDSQSCPTVRRAINNSTFFSDEVSDAGVPTGSHPWIIPPPLPVELTGFGASFNAGTATLNWSAASERDVIGYRLYRGKLVDIEDVVGEMIPNKGDAHSGGAYIYRDENIGEGVYTYILEAQNADGTSTFHLNEESVVINNE